MIKELLTDTRLHESYDKHIREKLPKWHTKTLNGVKVPRSRTILDKKTDPNYEKPLINGIERTVQPGDTVTVIGGGYGVSTVTALEAGAEHVTTYEPSRHMRARIYRTVQANGYQYVTTDTPGSVTVVPRGVGHVTDFAKDTYNIEKVYASKDPEDLEPVTVLVVDCEGAEIDILHNMDILPQAIIVETHGFLDSPVSEVKDWLREYYMVVDVGWEDKERGVKVLVGVDTRPLNEKRLNDL